jgi:hypothetical protein
VKDEENDHDEGGDQIDNATNVDNAWSPTTIPKRPPPSPVFFLLRLIPRCCVWKVDRMIMGRSHHTRHIVYDGTFIHQ